MEAWLNDKAIEDLMWSEDRRIALLVTGPEHLWRRHGNVGMWHDVTSLLVSSIHFDSAHIPIHPYANGYVMTFRPTQHVVLPAGGRTIIFSPFWGSDRLTKKRRKLWGLWGWELHAFIPCS